MPKIIDEFLTINEKSFPIKLGEVKSKENTVYIGEASIIDAKDFKDMNGENRVHFTLRLNNSVRQDIYDFITSFTDEKIS